MSMTHDVLSCLFWWVSRATFESTKFIHYLHNMIHYVCFVFDCSLLGGRPLLYISGNYWHHCHIDVDLAFFEAGHNPLWFDERSIRFESPLNPGHFPVDSRDPRDRKPRVSTW